MFYNRIGTLFNLVVRALACRCMFCTAHAVAAASSHSGRRLEPACRRTQIATMYETGPQRPLISASVMLRHAAYCACG